MVTIIKNRFLYSKPNKIFYFPRFYEYLNVTIFDYIKRLKNRYLRKLYWKLDINSFYDTKIELLKIEKT